LPPFSFSVEPWLFLSFLYTSCWAPQFRLAQHPKGLPPLSLWAVPGTRPFVFPAPGRFATLGFVPPPSTLWAGAGIQFFFCSLLQLFHDFGAFGGRWELTSFFPWLATFNSAKLVLKDPPPFFARTRPVPGVPLAPSLEP